MILQSTKKEMVRLLDEVMIGELKTCWNNLSNGEKMFIAEGALSIAVISVKMFGAKNS